jgi:transcriptional regulator with XRE-family HTH domain
MSYAELSRLTGQAGRPIATLGLARLEQGSRRIDVDDLFAIATALAVSPLSLLMVEDKPDCGDCFDLPPRGFTCNSCGLTRPKP